MSGLFSNPKTPTITQETVPEVIDNSEKVLEQESKRKKRMGAVQAFLADGGSQVSTGKKTLG